MKELLVRTGNRVALDKVLQQLGALVAEQPEPDGTYAVRAFPPEKIEFIRFAITNQGYAEIVGERDAPKGERT